MFLWCGFDAMGNLHDIFMIKEVIYSQRALIANISVRHVGVIWFVFHVLQLLLVRFLQGGLVALTNLTLKLGPPHDVVMLIGNAHYVLVLEVNT